MATSRTPEARGRSETERAAIARLVDDLGLRLSVDDFEETIREVISRTVANPEPEDAEVEFSTDERAALGRSGASFAPLPAGTIDPVERTRLAFGALLLDSDSADEAAAHLDRDVSRIRQRIRDRSLWGLGSETGSRLPRVQFDDDGSEIRGIGRVLQAMPADYHPIAVLRWLTRPHHDLLIDDVPVSPRDWLRSGGRISEVVELAEDLHVS
jgi:hypothetical protein